MMYGVFYSRSTRTGADGRGEISGGHGNGWASGAGPEGDEDGQTTRTTTQVGEDARQDETRQILGDSSDAERNDQTPRLIHSHSVHYLFTVHHSILLYPHEVTLHYKFGRVVHKNPEKCSSQTQEGTACP